MSLSVRSFPTDSTKYQILVRQAFACTKIPNYTCPILGKLFDEAGYDIDHVLALADGGSNDISNLQALCPSCHRVKTARENRARDRIRGDGSRSEGNSGNSGNSGTPMATAAFPAGAVATVQKPASPVKIKENKEKEPVYITDIDRVKNRVADYISGHYTKTAKGSGRLLMDVFLTNYNAWEAKNNKRRRTLPCDVELVKKVVLSLCPSNDKGLALSPK